MAEIYGQNIWDIWKSFPTHAPNQNAIILPMLMVVVHEERSLYQDLKAKLLIAVSLMSTYISDNWIT